MHGYIREREEIPNLLSHKHHNFAMPKHTDIIHDWRALVMRWLFMSFSYDFFLVILIKKSYMSVKYKRLFNRTHHKHEPQSSLA